MVFNKYVKIFEHSLLFYYDQQKYLRRDEMYMKHKHLKSNTENFSRCK